MRVTLGNVAPVVVERDDDGNQIRTGLDGKRETVFVFPEGTSVGTAFVELTSGNGGWNAHSDADPAWIESDDQTLQDLLANHYGTKATRPKSGFQKIEGASE